MIKNFRANEREKDFEVFEENWESVQLFLRLQTQWVTGMGGPIGLNYQSVDFVLRVFEVQKKQEVFDDIQTIEIAILNYRSGEKGARDG